MATILLINLGSPDSPTPSDLKKYLAEFLGDPYVVNLPIFVWLLILHGIILRFYPKKSAQKYQKIWTNEGSPLIHFTQKLAKKFEQTLKENRKEPIRVLTAMRYGSPSLENVIQQLPHDEKILALPLYPQFARSTTGSTVAKIDTLTKKFQRTKPIILSNYFDNHHYIRALKQQFLNYFETNKKPQKIIFSFHGLPEQNDQYTKEYSYQCEKTVRLLCNYLKLNEEDWLLCFQSRFGFARWLQPYTLETIQQLAQQGTKHIAVMCPGFAVDCLETLEEINMLNRQTFLNHGGETFDYIPALNDSELHVNLLYDLVEAHL